MNPKILNYPPSLTEHEGKQIAEILERRANEIAQFNAIPDKILASVDLALSREIQRLRALSARVKPIEDPTENDEP